MTGRIIVPMAVVAAVWLWLLAGPRIEPQSAYAANADGQGPKRVKALFLGDRGHHNPSARADQVVGLMGRRGIDIYYTEDLAELTLDNLKRYDCLIVYANIVSIPAEQEQAILDYVAGGGGYVPLHCGSYCFLNSPKLIALTGAQFKSHGTGVFRTRAAQVEHPITKGLEEIESWDETYVHHMHNDKDRVVLSYRDNEPWTWVRTEGKGRVFYTAWGHDQRTWSNTGFHDLLERGIRWASGRDDVTARPAHEPFEYVDGVKLPNYLPGKAWGTQGEPISRMQLPVNAERSMRYMVVPPGFEVKLFAAEPKIGKPICMAWDERGRLWIAETVDYPNDIQPQGQGNDRIRICEDTDGDGAADKFTVFAEKLSIPTSLVHWRGGVIVHQAPHTLYLKDTDGDDVADERKVLFTGWSTGDTHAGPNNLRYGLDNWIWGMQGYAGYRGTIGGEQHSFRQGFYRFKPDGSKMEFVRSTNNNTWGLGFSEEGIVFGSTANNNPSEYMPIPNRYYESVRGWSVSTLGGIADSPRFLALSDKVRQVDVHGGYTAAAGHALYTARSYPREYWNRAAFVTEGTGKLIGVFYLQRDGAGFRSTNPYNLVASEDEWTAPVMAEVGPDAAVWFIDWYNYVVQHNPTPHGFTQGKGNAYETELRDKKHGRVYRVVYAGRDNGARPSKPLNLHNAAPEQLVTALNHDNMLWRLHAQRLLVERGQRDVLATLYELVKDQSVDEVGLNVGAIHALWTMHGLGVLSDPATPGADATAIAVVTAALKHPSAGVRRNAVQVLPPSPQTTAAILASGVLDDSDAQVRLMSLLALADQPASEQAGAAVYTALTKPHNAKDKWLADAATAAAARHDAGFLSAVLASATPQQTGNGAGSKQPDSVNLLTNASFEKAESDQPAGWSTRDYAGEADHSIDRPGRTGERCVKIQSNRGSDSSWSIVVPVKPGTNYRLSAWIKTRGVSGAMGALLNVHELQGAQRVLTPAVKGTADWTPVSVTFNSAERNRITVNCLFGGWGQSRGEAWWDDVELIELGAGATTGLDPAMERTVRLVTGHYARRGPTDSIVSTLTALEGASPAVAAAMLDGLTSGWPRGLEPKFADADTQAVVRVMAGLSAENQGRLVALSQRWGLQEMFEAELAATKQRLLAVVADTKAPPRERIDAAERAMRLDDTPETARAIASQITPVAAPMFVDGLLNALGESRNERTAAAVLERWDQLTPTTRRTAIVVLMRRAPWINAMLDGIEANKINRGDLSAEHMQQLSAHADASIASRARKIAASGGQMVDADRQKVIDKLLPLANKPGDAERGKAIFTAVCAVCHQFAGAGGVIGPGLDGVGQRPRTDVLLDIIDPNRSVEGNYRMWVVTTDDGQAISGRLDSESQTAVEILDLTGKRHALQRDRIASMIVLPTSIMPAGFENLPAEDLTGLLEYLTHGGHAEK